jgi:hypothetical protein
VRREERQESRKARREPLQRTSVKRRALEPETLFSRAQGAEVLGGLRDNVRANAEMTREDHNKEDQSHKEQLRMESQFLTVIFSRHLLHNNAPRGLASNGDIKEALRVGPTIAANQKEWTNQR